MNGLAMFCKESVPGAIKTRWGGEIGMEKSAAAARLFQACLAARLASTGDTRVIVYTPETAEAAFHRIAGESWQLEAQPEGDLGQRLHRFASTMLAHVERLVILGSDSPDLPRAYVEQAFEQLQHQPVVLGPAQDGGYYLVGLSRFVPQLFADIPWSTSRVYVESCARLRATGVTFGQLPVWDDVDDNAGWLRVRERWMQSGDGSDVWIRQIDAVLDDDNLREAMMVGGGDAT